MARLFAAGAEVEAFNGDSLVNPATAPDGTKSGSGTLTRDTSVFRSGGASWKFDSGAGNAAVSSGFSAAGAGSSSVTNYMRVYVRVPAAPGTAAVIVTPNSTSPTQAGARLRTDGGLELLIDNVVTGSATASIADSSWHMVEMSATFNGSTQLSAAELRLDGVSVASGSPSLTVTNYRPSFGWLSAPGANTVINVDDFVVGNSIGSPNNTWIGAGAVILMKPSSDSQRGSWTGGAGGTTNLWDAVNNTPPTGTSSETNTTQIESTDSSGDNATDEYRGDCGSYTTAGIGASDTINAVRAFTSDGEDVATGTKTGSFGFQANPSATYSTFTFGDDAGALGSYGVTSGNWSCRSTIVDSPSVTMGSSLILAVRKTDAGTRVASICMLMAYVDYTPAVAATTSALFPNDFPRLVRKLRSY